MAKKKEITTMTRKTTVRFLLAMMLVLTLAVSSGISALADSPSVQQADSQISTIFATLDSLKQNAKAVFNKTCIATIVRVNHVQFFTLVLYFLLSRRTLELAQNTLPECSVLFQNLTHIFKYLFYL